MKRFLSIILVISMLFSMSSFVFADGAKGDNPVISDGYTRFDPQKTAPYSEENVQKSEQAAIDKMKKEIRAKESNNNNGGVIVYAVEYPDGTTRVDVSPLYSTGITYDDQSQSSIMLQNILSIGLTIAGYYYSTVQSIVSDVANIMFGMNWSEVVISQPGTAKLSHSYSYYDKLGKVYNASSKTWLMKVDIQRRLWFRHEYASFKGTDGYTHTATADFIPPNGYSAIHDEAKANYYNDSFINSLTYERYVYNQPTYYDVYQYVY